jgi:hypothetical protein
MWSEQAECEGREEGWRERGLGRGSGGAECGFERSAVGSREERPGSRRAETGDCEDREGRRGRETKDMKGKGKPWMDGLSMAMLGPCWGHAIAPSSDPGRITCLAPAPLHPFMPLRAANRDGVRLQIVHVHPIS